MPLTDFQTTLRSWAIDREQWRERRIQLARCFYSCGELDPRSLTVLLLRYHGAMTLDDVAEVLDLTRERIRQIENRALRTLDPEVVAQKTVDAPPVEE